ncbi:hypothetical protein SSX86_017572 [Deinandra increscens subsp. villosa]|uniref:Sulfhydryl oxidase n=1 Tax=Deinandra increscens subsp. villosa TaxID=3103831 RepID=A0AAP0CVE2_9ASTR
MFRFSITLFFLWSLVSSSSSAFPIFPSLGSRSILRAIKPDVDQPGSVVDLNVTNFDIVLKETPAVFVIVEFFAHWCPACRNYKPQYEKVARLFNGADAVHPGIILMARVDCANKINRKLCHKFDVSHYPMLLWGPPFKFVGGHWNDKEENSEIVSIKDALTAERLLKWINTQLISSYGFKDEKFENEKFLQSNLSDPGQIARAIYDVEEATNVAFDIILEHEMIKSDTRATFIKFLQIMMAHNPSRRCRKGIAEILVNFDDIYPSNTLSTNKDEQTNITVLGALHTFKICGKQVPRGYWTFCRGSRDDTRGFSCGLWILLHSLSVRVDDSESQLAFSATCDFVHKFFICEECSQHFHDTCSSVTTPFNTTREFVLWLKPHTETALSTGTTMRCSSSCNLGSEDLLASENTVAVPMGAAIAIAVASCLFGAVAYVWRSQQKNRKYFHEPRFLKNV